MKIIVKRVGKPFEFVETDEKYLMNSARKILCEKENVWLERVRFGPNMFMVVDEDGIPKGLPFNFDYGFNSMIFGDAVFVRVKPLTVNPFEEEVYDEEVDDATEEDLKDIVYRCRTL